MPPGDDASVNGGLSKRDSNQSPLAANTELPQMLGSKVVRFDELSRCGQEVWIEHAGQLYRLRLTRHGKLVLTK